MDRAQPVVFLALLLSTLSCGDAAQDVPPPVPDSSESTAWPRALWHDVTTEVLEPTEEWTNRVELADLNGDGLADLLFANGGDYSEPGTPEPNRVFFNRGPGERFEEHTEEVFGSTPDLARVIKVRDFDGSGHADIFVGTTYQTQSRLFLGAGDGSFRELTETHLPQMRLSVGDVEAGDVDGDGDLDLVLADWGPGNNMTNAGGRTRLWLNGGSGRFTDATDERMPELAVGRHLCPRAWSIRPRARYAHADGRAVKDDHPAGATSREHRTGHASQGEDPSRVRRGYHGVRRGHRPRHGDVRGRPNLFARHPARRCRRPVRRERRCDRAGRLRRSSSTRQVSPVNRSDRGSGFEG